MSTAAALDADPKAWFVHDRFGVFLHWGIYSHSGKEASWGLQRGLNTYADYDRYQSVFEGDLYDPYEWARLLRQAGIRYAILATKHHDGFSLWDTAYSDYKITNSPAGRDVIAPYVDALRKEGIKVGLYYSLIDWHHEQFPIDSVHPLCRTREDPKTPMAPRPLAEIEEMNKTRDMTIYAEFMRNQVRELLTNYGKIDLMWFDYSYEIPVPGQVIHERWMGKGAKDWESEKLHALARELQPDMVINNRLGLPKESGILPDFDTPEQFIPQSRKKMSAQTIPQETCIVFSDQWAYSSTARAFNYEKEAAQIVQTLIHLVSVGSNMLYGIGPTARGRFNDRAMAELDVYAKWMDLHSRSIYGCGPSQFDPPTDARLTQNGNRLYVHLFAWPFRHVHLPGLEGKIRHAQFLHDGSDIKIADFGWNYLNIEKFRDDGMVTLELPHERPDAVVPVIEIFLKD
ncbi:alpha-L-fucosidase [Kaistia sp. 32K]|nr:alpha-L-fucosidase [Kaistia sp. 32K]